MARHLSLVVILLIAGCDKTLAPQPASRAAGGNPACRHHCTVTITSVDENQADQLAPQITGTRTSTETEAP